MNYINVYNNIIDKAKKRQIDGYLETHHIIPKCLGGSDTKDNLVKLTAREHYVCHWLLAKHYNVKPLWYAFSMMCVESKRHQRSLEFNSRHYERAKIARSYAASGEGNPMFGKPSACKFHTEETKEKIRQSKLGKKRTPFTRPSPTEETRHKMSLAKKGVPNPKLKGRIMEKYECPHCGKIIGGISNFRRYHNDNCKHKVII